MIALILLMAASQAALLELISADWGSLWILLIYIALVMSMRLVTLSDINTLRALGSSQKEA